MSTKLYPYFLVAFIGLIPSIWGYSQPVPSPVFPLQVSENHRYLTDANHQPFFYQADTPWHLFFKLSMEEIDHYIAIRKQQGFNTLQIMLTGAKGQVNLYGESPWLGDHDFGRPNEKFFLRVDTILQKLEAANLYVALVPLWAGCCRGDMAGVDRDGQPLPMLVNGPEKTRRFGSWLGRRYTHHKNILWIIGGDNDPYGAPAEYAALVAGLKTSTNDHLFTYHAASTHSSTDVYPDSEWLDVSMVYTYFRGFNKAWNRIQADAYEVAFDEYMKNKMPFFLGESNYEGEHGNWGNPTQVRKQAYYTALSGGAGHAYGSLNWKMPANWRKVLEFPGAASLRHLIELMYLVDFQHLEPDFTGTFLIQGAGQYASNDYALTAFTKDRRGALVYVPSGRVLRFDQTQLSARKYTLAWFNPRTGISNKLGTFKARNVPNLQTPTHEDWVLLVNIEKDSVKEDR